MDSRSIKNFFQMASVLMVLVAVALVAAIVTMHFVIHGAEVQVPAFKGMTVAEARSQTSGLGLNLTVDNRYYSSDVAAGRILSQSPAAGTVVRREWPVRISESLGQQKVDVPEVVGRNARTAELELRRAGLGVGAIVRLPYAQAAEGTVLSQDPPAHAQDIAGPAVNLLVAVPDGDAVDGFVMPDLVGKQAASALADLAKMGLKATTKAVNLPIGRVGSSGNQPPRPPSPPGAVLTQSPLAGARVDAATAVKLTVAK